MDRIGGVGRTSLIDLGKDDDITGFICVYSDRNGEIDVEWSDNITMTDLSYAIHFLQKKLMDNFEDEEMDEY